MCGDSGTVRYKRRSCQAASSSLQTFWAPGLQGEGSRFRPSFRWCRIATARSPFGVTLRLQRKWLASWDSRKGSSWRGGKAGRRLPSQGRGRMEGFFPAKEPSEQRGRAPLSSAVPRQAWRPRICHSLQWLLPPATTTPRELSRRAMPRSLSPSGSGWAKEVGVSWIGAPLAPSYFPHPELVRKSSGEECPRLLWERWPTSGKRVQVLGPSQGASAGGGPGKPEAAAVLNTEDRGKGAFLPLLGNQCAPPGRGGCLPPPTDTRCGADAGQQSGCPPSPRAPLMDHAGQK